MKVRDCCRSCLRGLAEKTTALSSGDKELLARCFNIIDTLWTADATPTLISNTLLKHIRRETDVGDPYKDIKRNEFNQALEGFGGVCNRFPATLEGAIKLSAMGNSMDFFVNNSYNAEDFQFSGKLDKIKKAIYINKKDVLMIGDNTGDFIFDVPLIRLLENGGRRVHYAVRSEPVQNDLSMLDVNRFGLDKVFERFVSIGNSEVGINRNEMSDTMKSLWQSDAVVIAKGMGNYETISEFRNERPVIHIMKIKCAAVAEDTKETEGTYVTLTGGE